MSKLMIGLLALAFSATCTAAQTRSDQPSPRTDETVPVQKGMRLNVNDFAGEINVGVWDRDAVRVQADHSVRERVTVRTSDMQVIVRATSSMGPVSSMDLRITVPAWMRLDLSGTFTDITVDGAQGPINADTVRGDIRVKGGTDFVNLSSVEGVVTLESSKGRAKVHSVNEGIKLIDVAGDVIAETVNGTMTMERMQATSLDAATVNGGITYDGTIRSDGQYRLTSHNGDITMTVPDNTSATVSVRTYNGSFMPSFDVKPDEASRRNKKYNFTLGSGSAQITLESFGGTIRMTKRGRR